MEIQALDSQRLDFQQLEEDFLSPSSFESLVDLLNYRAEHHPQKIAFTFLRDGEVEEAHLSYRALQQQAIAIAAHLQTLGKPGDRAILLYPSQSVISFIAAFFGCLYAGFISVPTYPPRKKHQWSNLQHRLEDCDINLALTTKALKDRLRQSWKQEIESGQYQRQLAWIDTDWLLAENSTHLSAQGLAQNLATLPELNWDSVAYLQHTSGSTGIPKGVIVTHGNVLHNSEMIRQAFGHNGSLKGLIWLPFNHDMGLIGGILQPLYVGGRSIFMTSTAFIQKPVRWLNAISRYGITTSGGPNFAYDWLCQRVTQPQQERLDLSTWSVAFCGAEPVRARTLEQFSSKYASSGFKPQAFYPCYGMAEATLLISSGDKSSPPIVQSFDERALNQNQTIRTDRNQPGSRLLVSCGHSWMGGEIRIVNPETLTACSAREVGEIWVRGSGIGKGYWNHPKETKEVFQAYLLDTGEGPFLRTGDLGCLDHGELFVTGRLKEVIKLWGRGIYPQQLEESLENRHSAFLGCAAFSVEKDGAERIVIAQELDRQTCRTLTPQQVKTMIKQICRTLLIRHLVDVYAIAFLKPGGLPKTSSGKVQRRRCQTLFLTGELPAIEQWICPAKQRFNYARWCTWAFRLDKFNLLSKVLNL